MNVIPFTELKKQYHSIKGEILSAIKNVCEDVAFSGGKYADKFEKDFARYCKVKYCVGVNNGTSALHLAMLALGVGEGDEVIVPANTFIASASAVSHVGATPVFVDCDKKTWEIDWTKVEKKITKKTKGIIGVHLYGQPFNIEEIKQIAKQHKLFLVEDCAQAHGARYKGKKVGGFGNISCWSFYPGKNLGSYGEGGAITTNSIKYAKKIKMLRNHGSEKKYHHDIIGFNMRLEGIQGAVLSVKMKHLDNWNRRRKGIAKMYFDGITNPKITMQFQPAWSDSVYHLFVITTPNRNKLKQYLEGHGIFPGIHYPIPCHLQKAYKFLKYRTGAFKNTEYLADHCLSLPMFPELKDAEVKKVIKIINNF